ncbi:hypothetical protein B0H11DRAFT_2251911 [Mycena galericulata]|nr:hypothetical protein B0H11DRAFT_2251911 [Mycena galericulata]
MRYRNLQERRVAAACLMMDNEGWSAPWTQAVRSQVGAILVECLMDVAEVTRTTKDKLAVFGVDQRLLQPHTPLPDADSRRLCACGFGTCVEGSEIRKGFARMICLYLDMRKPDRPCRLLCHQMATRV